VSTRPCRQCPQRRGLGRAAGGLKTSRAPTRVGQASARFTVYRSVYHVSGACALDLEPSRREAPANAGPGRGLVDTEPRHYTCATNAENCRGTRRFSVLEVPRRRRPRSSRPRGGGGRVSRPMRGRIRLPRQLCGRSPRGATATENRRAVVEGCPSTSRGSPSAQELRGVHQTARRG